MPHTLAQSVGPGASWWALVRGRTNAPKGRYLNCGWFGSALVSLTNMGQAPRNKPKRLGEKLLQIREALGLSQKEMAKQLSERTGFTITHTHVSNYERDRVEPFLETTLAYARLGSVEMNEIADDDLELSL